MSLRPKKINFTSKSNADTNQKPESLDQIICIHVKPNKDENGESAERDKNNKATNFFRNTLKLNPTFRRTKTSHYNTQKESFDAAMKYLLLVAKAIGLFPFNEKKNTNTRWPMFSWRYMFCIFMSTVQLLATFLCFQSLVSSTVTISEFGYFAFYFTTLVSSISFMKLALKWDYLMRQLETAKLNEYIDHSIEYKCNFAVFIMLGLAFVEHTLSVTVKLIAAEECISDDTNIFKLMIMTNFYWLYELDVPYSMGFGVYLVVQNFIITMVWSYIHIFIICISLYLTSILVQINKVILSREGQFLPPSYWRKLREDYNGASRLVRCFDDVINSIVLTSFASNLLFVCLQLYNILAYGIHIKPCKNIYHEEMEFNTTTGQRAGYFYTIFSVYSASFLILRSVAVALFAARIHSESLVPAPALFSVPSPTFCTEVQRFIEQIHGNTVALTGLNFFYVTKELLLSVVGTIVTYELVLLQFEKV